MTPLLLLVFNVAPVTAVGTDLWFAAITKLVAGGIHHAKGLVDWQILKRMWLGSLPASGFLIFLLHSKILSVGGHFLISAVAVVVIITAVGMLFQSKLQGLGKHLRLEHSVMFKRSQPLLTVMAGILLGVLVTLTSIGAGALGVVLLTYLYPLRLTPSKLVATDIVHAIPLAIFAGLGHLYIGHVDFELLKLLLFGSIPGVFIGTKLAARLKPNFIRTMLALVLLLVSSKLLFIN